MRDESIIQAYWDGFLEKTGRPRGTRYGFCGCMGPNERIAGELTALILAGIKTATTSCLLSYQAAAEPVPKAGDLGIITDWNGNPRCVIENTGVMVLPFREMTYELCKREGEDDSLSSWQETHFRIFTEEGADLGYTFTGDTPVVFEDFWVIYP